MDENDFMASVIEEMDDAELEAFCEVMVQEINMSNRKEKSNE